MGQTDKSAGPLSEDGVLGPHGNGKINAVDHPIWPIKQGDTITRDLNFLSNRTRSIIEGSEREPYVWQAYHLTATAVCDSGRDQCHVDGATRVTNGHLWCCFILANRRADQRTKVRGFSGIQAGMPSDNLPLIDEEGTRQLHGVTFRP